MKTIRLVLFRNPATGIPALAKTLLVTAFCAAGAACTTEPARHEVVHESGAPPAYSQSVYRDAGVINSPNNTGNPPQDLDPHSVQWRDVRRPY
ncbi:MAG: hypothetical protein WDN28_19125 [Chthoniobacter sp.]